jgi:hypothetical protein
MFTTYDISGAGVVGTYTGTMTGLTNVGIVLTSGNGSKTVVVNYNN